MKTDACDNTCRSSKPALWLGILGLALLFVLLRWNNFNAPLTRDEGEYAYAAQLLMSGSVPYEQSFLQKPPMIAYSYALAGLLAPDVFWSPRILANVFAALATVLLGYAARREFGPGVAMPAMWLMTPMVLLPELNQFIANTEMFMILPLMATVAVYVRSRHSKGGAAHWLAAGTLASITICYKYTAFPLLAFIFAAWSFEEWRGGKGLRAIAGYWMAALSGGIFAAAIVLAPFLLRDGGKRLWECTVVFNRYYAASPFFGMSGMWMMLRGFWSFWWILCLVPCLLIFNLERRVWFWAALFILAWLDTLGSRFGHYYIVIMPFWAVLVAVALRGFAGWAAGKVSPSWNRLGLVLTGFVVLAVLAPDARWLTLSREQFAVDSLGHWKAFLESPLIAARLKQLTTAQDFVYVAGSDPEILCYARRFSSTRFEISYPLMIPSPLVKSYQAEVIHDLQQRPPAAIVLVRTGLYWSPQPGVPADLPAFVKKLLVEHYDMVGGCVSDGKRVRWQEPLGREDMAQTTMMLFKRTVP